MKLDVNLTESINYTKMLFNDLGKLLILIILDIIPIVNLVVLGYLGNIIKQSPDSKQLPPLDNYFNLWIQGPKILVASIIFMIIPIILIGPFILLLTVSWISIPILSPVTGLLAILLLIVGVILAFFLAIILTMAIVNMLKKDSFIKAFAFGEILNIIGKIGWGTQLLWLLILFVSSVIVAGIGGIPAIGWILSLIIAPIFGTFVARSTSLAYSEAATIKETETTQES